jgi:hypothetical protein
MYKNIILPPPPIISCPKNVSKLSLLPVLSPAFKEHRRNLNNMKYFNLMHPQPADVYSWKIPDPLKNSFDVPKNSTIFIDKTEEFDKFSDLIDNLKVKEIALDLEFDSSHLFHDCTALIQMSSCNFNVINDPFSLYEEVVELFSKIMMDKDIVKLVFDDADLRALQRDFSTFCIGIIDVQNICKIFSKKKVF